MGIHMVQVMPPDSIGHSWSSPSTMEKVAQGVSIFNEATIGLSRLMMGLSELERAQYGMPSFSMNSFYSHNMYSNPNLYNYGQWQVPGQFNYGYQSPMNRAFGCDRSFQSGYRYHNTVETVGKTRSSYGKVKLKSNGLVISKRDDEPRRLLGRISQGEAYQKGRYVGGGTPDGTILDKHDRPIGYVTETGLVLNRNEHTIGKLNLPDGLSAENAAAFARLAFSRELQH